MPNSPFRDEALADRSSRQRLDHLLVTTAPHERVVLAAIGLVTLALAAWLIFGTVTRTVTFEGLLVKPGDRHDVVSGEQGHLLQYLVAPGDRIVAGTPVARQSVPDGDREADALRDRLEALESAFPAGSDTRGPMLEAARAALLEAEARLAARALIVSHAAGEVMALRSRPGQFLTPGAVVAHVRDADGNERPHVALRLAREVASQLSPGMAAAALVQAPGGGVRSFRGEVAEITRGPLPGWLASLEPTVGSDLYRVDIVLKDAAAAVERDGTPCRVRVVLGQVGPLALLQLGSS